LIGQKLDNGPSKKFEMILSDNGLYDLNLELGKTIAIEIIVDRFQLNSFVQNDDNASYE
jgi:hypothetical protein